jgi:multisubunit Na+/H+ antiporter MnhE subunit
MFFYTLIWVIFSQNFTLEILILGLLFSYILTITNKSLLRYPKPKLKLGYFILFFEYLFVLLIEWIGYTK